MVTFLIVGEQYVRDCVAQSFGGNIFHLQRQVNKPVWGKGEDRDPDRLRDPEIDIVVLHTSAFKPDEIAAVRGACNGKLVEFGKGGFRAAILALIEKKQRGS